MEQATITSKGQVTIPKKIREKLDLKAGDKVNFLVDSDGVIKLQTQKKTIESLRGILHRPSQESLSIEEMEKGVTEYLKKKYSK